MNPYLVVSPGGNFSTHVYIGSQRISSTVGSPDYYGVDPRSIVCAGKVKGVNTINYDAKYNALMAKLKTRYDSVGVTYRGTDYKPAGTTFFTGKGSNSAEFHGSQYYYHSDHLGSSSIMTDLIGNVSQHIEYIPFGDVFIEERNDTMSTPYKFNAKELDEETGLYYYGARYYDPRTSVWISADPLAEKYPNMSSYVYCHNNPVNMIDPMGLTDYGAKNKTGDINALEKPNNNLDRLIILDDNNKVIQDKNGNIKNKMITVNDKNILPQLEKQSKEKNENNYAVTKSKEALKLFIFLSKNTTVEWSISGFRKNKNMMYYYLQTEHDDHTSDPSSGLFPREDLLFNVHSHSLIDGDKGASNIQLSDGSYLEGCDMFYITTLHNYLKEKGMVVPPHYVFHKYSNSLYKFNAINTGSFVKTIDGYNSLDFLLKK